MSNDTTPDTVGAIIVAAGSGVRMEGLDKLFTHFGGRPLICHSVAAFQECADIDRIVVVLSKDNLPRGRTALEELGMDKIAAIVPGGARRQDSVRAGLEALGSVGWVAVHDGGRPLIQPGMIARGIEAAKASGAAIPVIPMTDTIKEISDEGAVVRTMDRSRMWAVQTPQIFRYDLIACAHREVTEDATDDASMLEALHLKVTTYEGSHRNIKVTTPDDLVLVETYLG